MYRILAYLNYEASCMEKLRCRTKLPFCDTNERGYLAIAGIMRYYLLIRNERRTNETNALDCKCKSINAPLILALTVMSLLVIFVCTIKSSSPHPFRP